MSTVYYGAESYTGQGFRVVMHSKRPCLPCTTGPGFPQKRRLKAIATKGYNENSPVDTDHPHPCTTGSQATGTRAGCPILWPLSASVGILVG